MSRGFNYRIARTLLVLSAVVFAAGRSSAAALCICDHVTLGLDCCSHYSVGAGRGAEKPPCHDSERPAVPCPHALMNRVGPLLLISAAAVTTHSDRSLHTSGAALSPPMAGDFGNCSSWKPDYFYEAVQNFSSGLFAAAPRAPPKSI